MMDQDTSQTREHQAAGQGKLTSSPSGARAPLSHAQSFDSLLQRSVMIPYYLPKYAAASLRYQTLPQAKTSSLQHTPTCCDWRRAHHSDLGGPHTWIPRVSPVSRLDVRLSSTFLRQRSLEAPWWSIRRDGAVAISTTTSYRR